MAGQVLRVSQPSISAQLKQLEESLGTPLFTRTTRSLVLTDTGQTVLETHQFHFVNRQYFSRHESLFLILGKIVANTLWSA
jgi:hypothetical protein